MSTNLQYIKVGLTQKQYEEFKDFCEKKNESMSYILSSAVTEILETQRLHLALEEEKYVLQDTIRKLMKTEAKKNETYLKNILLNLKYLVSLEANMNASNTDNTFLEASNVAREEAIKLKNEIDRNVNYVDYKFSKTAKKSELESQSDSFNLEELKSLFED